MTKELPLIVVRNNAIWEASIDKLDKLILLNLASRMGTNGYCWPTHKTIAKDTGMSLKSVKRHLSSLLDSEILLDVGENRYGYHINIEELKKFGYSVSHEMVSPTIEADSESVEEKNSNSQGDHSEIVRETPEIVRESISEIVRESTQIVRETPEHLKNIPKNSSGRENTSTDAEGEDGGVFPPKENFDYQGETLLEDEAPIIVEYEPNKLTKAEIEKKLLLKQQKEEREKILQLQEMRNDKRQKNDLIESIKAEDRIREDLIGVKQDESLLKKNTPEEDLLEEEKDRKQQKKEQRTIELLEELDDLFPQKSESIKSYRQEFNELLKPKLFDMIKNCEMERPTQIRLFKLLGLAVKRSGFGEQVNLEVVISDAWDGVQEQFLGGFKKVLDHRQDLLRMITTQTLADWKKSPKLGLQAIKLAKEFDESILKEQINSKFEGGGFGIWTLQDIKFIKKELILRAEIIQKDEEQFLIDNEKSIHQQSIRQESIHQESIHQENLASEEASNEEIIEETGDEELNTIDYILNN